MSEIHHITVCICTYKRPEMLSLLLSKLEKQKTRGIFDYSIVIVDNDTCESARQTAELFMLKSKISFNYFVEHEQNIALARNKAIENAKGDFIGLIDDDELPEEYWLLNLYNAIQIYKVDGILGPVIPSFDKKPPKWVVDGHFFDRPTHETGFVLDWSNTRTGNALLKRNLFTTNSNWFNAVYGSGGEDRDFFRRKIAEGHAFIWCEEAKVFETIPPERWDRKLLMKRALLRGKMALNSSKKRNHSIFISIVAVVVYTCCLPVFLILGHHIFMKYLIKNCDHLGKILAYLGIDLVKEKYVSS